MAVTLIGTWWSYSSCSCVYSPSEWCTRASVLWVCSCYAGILGYVLPSHQRSCLESNWSNTCCHRWRWTRGCINHIVLFSVLIAHILKGHLYLTFVCVCVCVCVCVWMFACVAAIHTQTFFSDLNANMGGGSTIPPLIQNTTTSVLVFFVLLSPCYSPLLIFRFLGLISHLSSTLFHFVARSHLTSFCFLFQQLSFPAFFSGLFHFHSFPCPLHSN